MKTWNYKGTQSGYKTHIMRYPDGDIVIFQSVDSHNPGDIHSPKVDAVRFNEKQLLKILKDKKAFPRKKKRGKK